MTVASSAVLSPMKAAVKRRGGAGIDALGRAVVLDPPVIHDDAMVGERHCLLLVMGDMNEGGADALLHGLELVLHLAPELEVEGAERLVEQQHGRLDDQGAGQRHALPLAAGELMRPLAADGLSRPTSARRLRALLRSRWPVEPRIRRPKPTLAADRHMRKERIVLEDRRGRPLRRRQAVQSAPLMSTSPSLEGKTKPPRIDSSVVLPEPEGPSSTV